MQLSKFITLIFFTIFTTNFYAQYSISGYAYDGLGNVLPNAKINLLGNNQQKNSQTTLDGHYAFSNVSKGVYRLTIEKEGVSEEYTVSIDNRDVEIELQLIAWDDTEVLNTVEIEVESVKSKIEKEGFAVNVIETNDAALRNIQTNELLDRSVGVRVRQNGGLGSSVDYNLNGLSGNAIKIFIDGLPIATYGPSFSLNSIPPAQIERIEVYKGVVPVHLSDDALGGAINVVLKKGLRNSVNASVSYGSFNTFQSNFNANFRSSSGFTFKTSGFYNYSDNDYEVWGKFVKNVQPNGRVERVRAKRFNDAYKSLGGLVEVGFTDVKWADHFLIGFNISDSYREVQHGTYMTKPYMGRFVESDNQVVSLNYRKKDFLLEGLRLGVSGMYSKRHEVVNDTVKWNYNWYGEQNLDLDGNPILSQTGAQQGAATILHSNREIYTLRADLSYKILDNHQLVFNHMYYGFRRKDDDEMKSALERSFIETRNLTKNITSFAYEAKWFDQKLKTNAFTKHYVQGLEKIRPTMKVIDGVNQRVDERTENQFTYVGYGGAFSYLLRPAIVLLGSAEEAIRLPSEAETFGDVGENIVENTGLQPEVSSNYNAGFKIGPYKIKEHKISLGGSVFLRDTKDKIVRRSNTRINDAEQVAPFENLAKTKSKGFEAEFMYQFKDKINLLVNASRFNTVFNKQFDANGNEFGYYNQQLPNEPFFTVNGSVQYSIHNILQKKSLINLYYNFSMIEGFYTNWLEMEDFKTPNQFIQDVGLSYVFPNRQFVVSFDAKNIFNKEAYDNFAVQKPGRAFYVKLNYSFNKF